MAKEICFRIPGNDQEGYLGASFRRFYLRELLPDDPSVIIRQLRYTNIYFKTLNSERTSSMIFRVHFVDECMVLTNNADRLIYSFTPEEVYSLMIRCGEKFAYGDGQKTEEVTQIECISKIKKVPLSRFTGLQPGLLVEEFRERKNGQLVVALLSSQSQHLPTPVEELVVG